MPGQAQPDVMPFLRMRMDNVIILEPGLTPTSIVTAGTDVHLRAEFGFDGLFAPLLIGEEFEVWYHTQNLETGATATLAGGAVVIGAAILAHATVLSPAYATGAPGTAFPVPAGYAAGTYRIMAHIHAASAAVEPIVTAFFDGTILMVS